MKNMENLITYVRFKIRKHSKNNFYFTLKKYPSVIVNANEYHMRHIRPEFFEQHKKGLRNLHVHVRLN